MLPTLFINFDAIVKNRKNVRASAKYTEHLADPRILGKEENLRSIKMYVTGKRGLVFE